MRHARHVFVGLRNAEDGMLVDVECDRATVFEQLAFQGLEIAECGLGRHEPQFHQRTSSVVDEDEQGAGIAPILKPTVV